MSRKKTDPLFLVVDLFCGAGGVTTGFAMGGGIAKVIACVNHDPVAIESHWANHRGVKHFEEDIRTLKLQKLVALVNRWRKRYPDAKVILWASLECTNFSNAKGGQSREADSRTLATGLYKVWCPETGEYVEGDSYIQLLNPDYVMIENVVEFMAWGPLRIKAGKSHKLPYPHVDLKMQRDKKTKELGYQWEPVSTRNGEDWLNWRTDICQRYGYRDDWKQMNSANFGAYTSRNRLFGIFAKDGLPIDWPEPTHAKKAKPASDEVLDLFGVKSLQPWKPVKDCLDFTDEGYSIFYRSENTSIPKKFRRNIADPTYERVYEGLIKHVAGGKEAFIAQRYSGNAPGRIVSVDGPARTLTTTAGNQDLVQASFLTKAYSGQPEHRSVSLDTAAGAINASDHHQLIRAAFITNWNGTNAKTGIKSAGQSIEGSCPEITTRNHLYLTQVKTMLSTYNGNSHTYDPDKHAAPTLTTKENLAVFRMEPMYFIDKQYGSGPANVIGIHQPAGTIVKNDKHSLVRTVPFIDRQFGTGRSGSVDAAAGAVLPVPKMNLITPFIVPTNYTNSPTSLTEPLGVITANRKWHYLLNPSWGGNTHDVGEPCPVLIARQDKAPLYLLDVEHGPITIPVYPDDSEIVIKIKEFMVLYGIKDIKMRMLRILELLKIQGFPEGYELKGTQEDQKKFIGNSVVPVVVKVWHVKLGERLRELRKIPTPQKHVRAPRTKKVSVNQQ